jgi:hypothetical protein
VGDFSHTITYNSESKFEDNVNYSDLKYDFNHCCHSKGKDDRYSFTLDPERSSIYKYKPLVYINNSAFIRAKQVVGQYSLFTFYYNKLLKGAIPVSHFNFIKPAEALADLIKMSTRTVELETSPIPRNNFIGKTGFSPVNYLEICKKNYKGFSS